MSKEEILKYALEQGFSDAAIIETKDIVFDPSFRPYCEENLCGQYGVNYTCPPVCGSPEEMKQKVLSHKYAIVLQSLWEISDYSDKKAIRQAKTKHNSAALQVAEKMRSEHHEGFVVGASGCALCTPCAMAQNQPCRFPELAFSCMSAYCIFVRLLTEKCGMTYNWGDGLLAFFGMYVFD